MPKTDVGVGVAVAAFAKDGRFVMLRRTGLHAHGTWCLPGGWLEKYEEFEAAARREVIEEIGCRIRNVRVAGISNHIRRDENHHTVTVHLCAMLEDGEVPRNMEPEKSGEIRWVDDWDDMPSPVMCDYSAVVSKAGIEKYLAGNI
ncbi:MAG: NUDIX domain-containing protein [Rickettsiales bacterium]|jgi:ADP-ribose pyrophosphatase YjhB (NUDIX family)|nr:NUDIX domain-containing protein [Rickettsiales bacterium]